MTISKNEFIRVYVQAIHAGTAAVFAGAGLSRSSGYADWKELLRPLAKDIGLDVDKEKDYLRIAQYYQNSRGGSRGAISQAIVTAFTKEVEQNENVRILARLPISTYWTTNYDPLIESALREANREPDVKSEPEHLAILPPNRDAVVYKMHGDVLNPAHAVLTKDDYELYEYHRPLFRTSLKGDLIAKTFLFIGFSFEDPNFDYILGQIRSLLKENVRDHYCFFKRVQRDDYKNTPDPDKEYGYHLAKQDMQIENLKRYGIQTVLVDQFDEITEILHNVEVACKMNEVFISGSADEYSDGWSEEAAQKLVKKLTAALVKKEYRITSGFGLGIGSSVVNSALEVIYREKNRHTDRYLCLRPFPQNIADPKERKALWTKYRQEMLSDVGTAIFLFGNKKPKNTPGDGNVVIADGCLEEFKIAKASGKSIIPLGSTGYAARQIYDEVKAEIEHYPYLEKHIDQLGTEVDVDKLIQVIMDILEDIKS